MTRELTLAAAQLAPVEPRASTGDLVERLLALLQQAVEAGVGLVIFPDATFSLPAVDEGPSPSRPIEFLSCLQTDADIAQFFEFAKRAQVGLAIGVADCPVGSNRELRQDRYSSYMLVDQRGALQAFHQSVHPAAVLKLDAAATESGVQSSEQVTSETLFEPGELGFRAVEALGGNIGLLAGWDDRFSQSWSVLGLQRTELVCAGSSHANFEHGEPNDVVADWLGTADRLRRMSIQAGALQNGTWAAVSGFRSPLADEFACGGGLIVSPDGQIVAETEAPGDALAIATCSLDAAVTARNRLRTLTGMRRPDHYAVLAAIAASTKPRGQDLSRPIAPVSATATASPLSSMDAPEATPETTTATDSAATPVDPAEAAIVTLFTSHYGFDTQTVKQLAEKALAARALETNAEAAETGKSSGKPKPAATPGKTATAAAAAGKPLSVLEKLRAQDGKSPPASVPAKSSERPAATPNPPKPAVSATDTAAAIVSVFEGQYGYESSATKAMSAKAQQALALGGTSPPTTIPQPPSATPSQTAGAREPFLDPEPDTTVASQAKLTTAAQELGRQTATAAVSASAGQPVSVDKMDQSLDVSRAKNRVKDFLLSEYGFAPELAEAAARKAEAAGRLIAGPGEPVTTTGDEPPTKAEPANTAPSPKMQPATEPSLPPTAAEEPPATIDYAAATEERDAVDEQMAHVEVMSDKTSDDAATKNSAEAEDRILLIQCPKCEFPMKIPESKLNLLGRKARCPQCRVKFLLPSEI